MAAHTSFRPFVPASESPKELSVRALLLGGVFGVLFGAVTVYVGLRAGLTVLILIAAVAIFFVGQIPTRQPGSEPSPAPV